MTAIAFSPRIGPVSLNVIVSEQHTSEIEITANPIETGAEVNDHAYVMPKKVTLDVADENAAATYAALVRFQESRVPFVLVTGLSVYGNMLVKAINADRDKSNTRVLRARVDLQEVIIVSTAYAAVDVGQAGQTSPGEPGGDNSTKSAAVSPESSGDAPTADRAAGTVQRGDAPASTVAPGPQRSLLSRTFN